jgi:cyclophilin family peptidyl-prolyl cis-trans isomerase
MMKQFLIKLSVTASILFFFSACSADEKQSTAKTTTINDSKNTVILLTNKGNIKIKLYPEKAPITVKNFLSYVDSGFYNDTIFHRVIPGFVIQGGGFSKEMDKKKTLPPIKNEADNGLKNLRGTLSMARTNIVNSATSQFFINLKDNDSLDHGTRNFGYAVFAEVIEGMEVVDKIASTETTNSSMANIPVEQVIIKSALRSKDSNQ